MADLGMDADVPFAIDQFKQFVESGGAEGDLPGPLSILINHFGDNLQDFIAQGSENFGQQYVNAINSRYPDVPAMRSFLVNLADLTGHETIDCFFADTGPEGRAFKIGLGNEAMYDGAGDIGKRIRAAVRRPGRKQPQPQPTPPATPRRGAGESKELRISLFLLADTGYNNTNIAHSFSIPIPSSSVQHHDP